MSLKNVNSKTNVTGKEQVKITDENGENSIVCFLNDHLYLDGVKLHYVPALGRFVCFNRKRIS